MNRDTVSLRAPNEIAPRPIRAHATTTPSQPYQVSQPIGVLRSLGIPVYSEARTYADELNPFTSGHLEAVLAEHRPH